jgi:putative transcriptional regulator
MTAFQKPNHHPCCNTLFRYAQGSLSPAMHMFITAHLGYCPNCRQELQAYESQAGLGLESLPPEALDSSCLENLLHKIEENGPPACIDVTIPACAIAQHRFPDALRGFVGTSGEHIKWDYTSGYAQWIIPIEIVTSTRLLCLDTKQDMSMIVFEKHSLLLVLDGALETGKKRFGRGDILKAALMQPIGSITNGETLCLVVVPTSRDTPCWFQRLMAFICGDKN